MQLQHRSKYGSQEADDPLRKKRRETKQMAYTTQTRSFALTLGERLGAARARLAEAAAQRKVYRTTFNELNNLTSRELADLGLSRSMIKSVALEAAYGK